MSALVEAARFNWPYQAELCRAFLEARGLRAVVFDSQSAGYSDGALVGVRVMVLEEELTEARELLGEYDS